MQGALRDLVGRTEVYNVAGAGGTIGLSQFVRLGGDPTQLMTTGLIMVGAVEANKAPNSLADTTPLVRLTTDYGVIVVPAESPLQDMKGVADAMRADVGKVSISGGSAGGAEQILAGLLAKAVGANPADVSYVAHSGGGEALSTLLSGRSTIGISGVSEISSQIKAGTVRALAVSSPRAAARAAGRPDAARERPGRRAAELARRRRAEGHQPGAGEGAGGPAGGHDPHARLAGRIGAPRLGRRDPGRPGVRAVRGGRAAAHVAGAPRDRAGVTR